MLNVFISMRIKGLTYEQAVENRDAIANAFIEEHEEYKDQINIINSLFDDYTPGESNPIEFLGRSITAMKDADVVLVPFDYFESKGCDCEYNVALQYGIPMKAYAVTKRCIIFIDII